MSSSFTSLVQTAEANPAAADFAALRAAYLTSEAYRPAKHIMQSKLMQITNAAPGFEQVSETCRRILSANPMDLEARRLYGLAQEELGNAAAAEQAYAFAEAMIDAILQTGDGKSIEGAWHVVAEAEIWTLFKIFGMRPSGQTRQAVGERIYDIFDGQIDDRPVTMYFDVTPFVRHIDQLISDETG
ncbi:MAG: DUF4919 domain-containing protein [Anaerolineae bacterium]|nr:DUF4919 domain-containing protein [Anaerolineae bacterium]